MKSVAIYARYSTDFQREASIEDQVRVCRERAEREGWKIINVYSDHAISGASLMRPGIQMLMQDAANGQYDLVMAEALDRLSRDQEDIAGLYKRLTFANTQIFTLSEGEISNLHIGLKGTMNALFLKDLADKTRRGLRGRVEQGKAGGGLVYGYDVVKKFNAKGEVERGDRTINEEQAEIVRRIFTEYVEGISPKRITRQLNEEGIPAPTGGTWGPSTIHGNRARGTGILNNELYIGRMIWNRMRYIKDPDTGKRVSRENPKEDWVIKEVPEMRILDQELWDQAKAVQGTYARRGEPLSFKKRPTYLLSHLVKCGCCDGGYAMYNQKRLACSTSINKGTCNNKLTIAREDLENRVLSALRTYLMDDKLTEEFCKAYTKRLNEIRHEHNKSRAKYQKELARLERERKKIVDSICEGVPTELIKDRAIYVQNRKEELLAILEAQEEEQVLFHPQMAGRYQKEIRNLISTLQNPKKHAEASKILRSLIDRIVLTPNSDGTELTVDLVGDLAGILSIATNRDKSAVSMDLSKCQPVSQDTSKNPRKSKKNSNLNAEIAEQVKLVAGVRSVRNGPSKGPKQVTLVAGVGFEPTTFRL
jgi:site-specific DNA recombinase